MRIDEERFLARFLPRLTYDSTVAIPPGDDCAALYWNDEELLLLSTDQLAEGTHYEKQSPDLLGEKLLKRNLSDIAAMGGTARYALLGIAFDAKTSSDWLDAFATGIRKLASDYQMHIIGGDLCRAKGNVASLTILGTVAHGQVCRRNQARPGEIIVLTGRFGGSLENGRHLDFTPRLNEARWIARHGFSKAMIDVSDGLLIDLHRLAQSSRVDAILDEEKIPCSLVNESPVLLQRALSDGEDYELLFSVARGKRNQLFATWPFSCELTEIGELSPLRSSKSLIMNVEGIDLFEKYPLRFSHFPS